MKSPQLLASGSTSINMTPMIDVVFLLIIFFLVSSHMAKQESSIPLDLPSATAVLPDDTERDTLVINILASGAWRVGGAEVDEPALASFMRRSQMAAAEPLRLKIRTDKLVPYERIEPLLRAASELGIGDIVFSVYEERSR